MNSKQEISHTDSDDEDGRLKRSRITHDNDRNEDHFECSRSAPKAKAAKCRQKRSLQHSVDEEKMAKLKACFSSDSDSDDDDPVASIKKKQIAARRMKGWKIPDKRESVETIDDNASKSPEKVEAATEESSLKQPSEESVLPSSPMLQEKMTDGIKGNDGEMMLEETIPTPKQSPTKMEEETPMKSTNVRNAGEGKCNEMMNEDSACKDIPPPVKETEEMMKVDVDDVNEAVSLTIVSWNISSAQSSNVAPNPALRTREAPRLIREEILRSQPDVIALQETAYPSFGAETFTSFGYVSIGRQTALHTDEYVDLLVKRELAGGARRIALQSFQANELPAVASIITLKNRTRIAIASLHLPHTKQAAPFRKLLCGSIMEQLTSQNCEGIILTGDFNMRGFEDKTTEKLCGGNWKDAWKTVTNADKETKFTWNSRLNKYHGPENFQWTCRLDRCYVKSEKGTLKHFSLIGNQPVGKASDYLSDHFGIVVKCDFASSDSNNAMLSVGAANALGSTTSTAATTRNSSLKDGSNPAALRAARLQRFENHANSGTNEAINMRTKQTEVIEIDLEDDCEPLHSLESDRALAERLQQEEEINAHRPIAENASQVDYSAVRPGVFETMRDKRAYLQSGNDTTTMSASQNGAFVAHVRGGILRDTHPQAWSSGGWVWVKNPQYVKNPKARVDKDDHVAKMSTEWNRLVASNAKITHRHLIELATKHNVLHGKWLLYVKAEDIVTDWPKIRNAVIEGKLGSTAKISDAPDDRGSHVVCIYCPNFLDKDELLRVRRSISYNIGLYKTSVLRYKLDAFTYLNVYAKNQWKLKTCSYECGGKKDEECSTLISSWEVCTCATNDCCKRCYKSKEDSDIKDVYPITGLKYAEATAVQGEKVTLLREPENKFDSNAVKVVNIAGKLIGHIAKDKSAILASKMKEMHEDIVKGTIFSVSDGYLQSVKVEFRETSSNESNDTKEVEVIVLE